MSHAPTLNTGLAQDLRMHVAEAGCPVCRLLRAHEERYWDGLLYEGFQDAGVLAGFAETLGMCPRHVRQLGHHNDAFAAAHVAAASLAGAQRAVDGASSRRRARRLPRPGDGCPVCESLASSELHALQTLGALVGAEPTVREQYERSDGLCVDHVRRAVALRQPAVAVYVERLARVLDARRAAVEAFIAAHDYHHTDTSADSDSWCRAFAALRDVPGATPASSMHRSAPPSATVDEDRRRGRFAALLAVIGAVFFAGGGLLTKVAYLLVPWGCLLLVLGALAVAEAVLVGLGLMPVPGPQPQEDNRR